MSERTVQSLHAKQAEIGTESELHNCEGRKKKKSHHFLAITHIHNFILSCQNRNKKPRGCARGGGWKSSHPNSLRKLIPESN